MKIKKETVKVDSIAIKKANYNYETKALTLTFVNGKKYEYQNVPEFTFEGMRRSDSVGKFINRFIIKNFDYKYAR